MPLAGLFLVLAMSGCAGKAAKPEETSAAPPTTSAAPTTTSPEDENKELKGVSDAKRHYHHYWGGAEQVDIFNGPISEFQQDAFTGSDSGCYSVGHRYFDLESDGNDATNEQGSNPVNPSPEHGPNPKADVVFAGTDRIDVKLLSQELSLGAAGMEKVFFRYKPANLNFFQPDPASAVSSCGILLTVGQTISIPVSPQAADPPHQWAVSRWKFFVIVASQQDENGLELPSVGQGSIKLQMTAHNGGEASLDAAHPDLWGTSLTYSLGCTGEQTVDRQLILQGDNVPVLLAQEPRDPMTDIAPKYGRIVPLLTQKVVVTVDQNYTGPLSEVVLDLEYAAADTNVYAAPPTPPTKDGSRWTWEIPDEDGTKADPPYLDKSLWRFRLVPHSRVPENDQGAKASDFTGNFNLCAVAHRDPNAILT